ncbi:hypothetical protein GBAR_LOCUS2660 [Geodia barretti]|uniref:Uncharacterized protein n=1 Tax=Geodia barretti TaxID=519541 RepID=A0AA35R141_GEOBA|nr:hypothetical protein GBAR_LOCUS2660 [Geodia barretti]
MNEGCLHHCVEIWVTNLQPSWEKLSHVLKELGEEELARQVLNKGQNDAANDQVVSYQDNTRDGGEMVLKVRQRHITNKKRNEGSNVMTYLGQCARPAAPFPQDVKDLEKNNPDSGMVEPSSQELKGGTTPELWSTDSGGGKEMLAGEGGSDGEGEVAGGEGQTGGIVNGHQEGGVGGGKPSRGSDSKVVTGVEETVFYTYDSEAGSRKGENVVPPDDCSSDVQYDRSTFTVIEESPIISCSDKEESGIIKPCTVVPLMVSSSEEEKYNADFGEIVTGVQGGEDCHPQFICPQISHPYSDISSQARGRGIFTGEVKAPKQNVDGFYGTESYREVDNCRDINDDCCDEPVFESMECMDSFAGKPLYPLFTYGFSEEGVMVTGVMNDIPSEEPTPHLPESPNQPLPAVARSFFPWIRPSFFYLRKAIKRTEKLFEPLMNRIFRPLKRPGYPFPSLDLPLKTSSQQPQGQGSSSLPTPARVLPAWLRELMAAKQTNWPDPPENYHKIVKWMYAGVGFNGPGKLMNFGSSPIVG